MTAANNFSTKQEFLNNEIVSEFVIHLTNLINGKKFKHSYNKWQCFSLIDAKNRYHWQGQNYDDTKASLDVLSKQLKYSILKRDAKSVLINVIKIMDWGQVHKGCITYVLKKFDQSSLIDSLSDAIDVLDGDDYNLQRFDQKDLRMDSGLTKVYSLGSKHSIIYDSRVTAAMLLIGYRYFGHEKLNSEIKELELFAGSNISKKRSHINNSKVIKRNLKDNSLSKGSENIYPHAHFNLIANWMLQEAIAQARITQLDLYDTWGVNDESEMLRAVEAALFMIGADITNG
ncbi:hypothetical protein JQC92_15930 [Shewanella sp. 202IG2-18]|uniref:hypothetical protein n=1 Tax=Parashewanella hymeniacidonis TaxID=2807618 RepID=UPI001960EA85|nr:hypothetical protein [Parashewanella hymeniacidonis]MBM7073504.1 hypothetical protein [Parashewanella hymeniacidonis]